MSCNTRVGSMRGIPALSLSTCFTCPGLWSSLHLLLFDLWWCLALTIVDWPLRELLLNWLGIALFWFSFSFCKLSFSFLAFFLVPAPQVGTCLLVSYFIAINLPWLLLCILMPVAPCVSLSKIFLPKQICISSYTLGVFSKIKMCPL